jgi:hypothetical protein
LSAHRPSTPSLRLSRSLHSTPLLTIVSALFPSTALTQPFSFQSPARRGGLPHSFYRHGGVPPLSPRACPMPLKNRRPTIHLPQMKSSPLCTFLVQCKSFRNNTCKSVSKQMTLTLFRMNTYEKHGGGGGVMVSQTPDGCLVRVEFFLFQRRIVEKLPSATSAEIASISAASGRSSVTLADLARTAS